MAHFQGLLHNGVVVKELLCIVRGHYYSCERTVEEVEEEEEKVVEL